MHIDHATLLYFSPTGTTRKILRAVAAGMNPDDTTEIDLTRPAARSTPLPTISDAPLLIGMPVYEERVPTFLWPALRQLRGNGQPAILVAVYGNVGAGLVLEQLAELVEDRGFRVVAGGSFVAEHSFTHVGFEIAAGRPDEADLEIATTFGRDIRARLTEIDDLGSVERPDFPAHLPLMARILPENSSPLFTHPPAVDRDTCTQCGACTRACPMGAIDADTLDIDEALCVRCFACSRACRPAARQIRLRREWLVRRAMKGPLTVRKEPAVYW